MIGSVVDDSAIELHNIIVFLDFFLRDFVRKPL